MLDGQLKGLRSVMRAIHNTRVEWTMWLHAPTLEKSCQLLERSPRVGDNLKSGRCVCVWAGPSVTNDSYSRDSRACQRVRNAVFCWMR